MSVHVCRSALDEVPCCIQALIDFSDVFHHALCIASTCTENLYYTMPQVVHSVFNKIKIFFMFPMCDSPSVSIQVDRRSPQHHYRPRHTLDGAKMRASVRMTRYLESWGAAKPFANLHHRDSMTNENGKINTAVSNFHYTYIEILTI